ncbi:MAG: thiamine pyrophosphate-dependent dehydrogenase E1 component subunit alpha [Sedimentibacter sp.]|uniref:thiamine pyrophosphate-dependent dehydrogenase E1 component subunit alpha n=1 Tax=Sedimentibacter sp. TaxID=1960295 RepID=UPI0031592B53
MEVYSKELLKSFYYKMNKIRRFEETVERYFLDGEIPGFVHLYIGEEAIATGVCASLTNQDYIASTHRGHGHTIAKGADINRVMAEIFGKKTGSCKGKGGSMHIADFSVGMLGANGVVGGGFNLATGAALAIKKQKRDNVAVTFFGDGSSNRGTFHEALNLASAWKLPAIYVCENNQWASTTPYRTTTAVEDIAARAAGYSMASSIVDGNDVFAVYESFRNAMEYVKAGNGPFLLEAKTYRIKGHFVGDPELYRLKEEVQKIYDSNNPITRFEERVLGEKTMMQEELDEIKAQVEAEIKEALDFALNSEYPDPSELFEDLYV